MPELDSFLQPIFDHPAFRAARAAAETPRPPAGRCPGSRPPAGQPAALTISGLIGTAKAIVAAGLAHELRRPQVVITADNETADRLCRTASTVLEWLEPGAGSRASVLPAVDSTPYEGRSPHPEISERRAVALWNAARGRTTLLFVPLPAALGRFREKSYYGSLALELKVGDEVSLEDLADHLRGVGYEPGEPVEIPGQFSVRGGIVDIFPPEVSWPSRLEFFGDRVESLREFDPNTQRSRDRAEKVLLLPFAEMRRSPRLFEKLVEVLARRQNAKAEPEWAAEYSAAFPGWEFFVPLVEPHTQTLLSLLDTPVLIWDEPVERRGQLRAIQESWASAYDEVRDVVPPRPRPDEVFLNEDEFLKAVEGTTQVSLKELAIDDTWRVSESFPAARLASQPPPKFHGAVAAMVDDLRARREQSESIAVVLPTAGKVDRLREILSEYEIPYGDVGAVRGSTSLTAQNMPKGEPARPSATSASGAIRPVLIARGDLNEGVCFPDMRLTLFSDAEIFGEFAWERQACARNRRSRVSSRI